MSRIEKVAVIGLDCAEPSLMFDRFIDDLPNVRRLMEAGTFGHLKSSMPPITVPAWSCMASSKDPGTLGIYGFRNRVDHSYDKLSIATSVAVKEPRIWDILGEQGNDSIIIGVPGTFPIMRPVRGCMITSFLTPGIESAYTWPRNLKDEIAELVGEYMVDVRGFRTDNKQWLLDQIYEMTDKRFKVAKHLLSTRPWDLFWMVEMGVDRIHHGFWQYFDENHHRYEPGNPFENAIHDYYIHIDKLIGELLDVMDLDKTAVWIVSDHGAKCMVGGFCFNDWLIREGYLHLKEPPTEPTRCGPALIDWDKTRAWGEGGYYGRCFLNIRGREPNGTVDPNQAEALRDELIAKLTALPDHEGKLMGTHVHKAEETYKTVNRIAPDLIVIFGDLRWRSVGTVGNPDVYTFDNDTGPDDANHAQEGLYVYAHPSLPPAGRRDDATLYDVAPTLLSMLGKDVPSDMQGRVLVG